MTGDFSELVEDIQPVASMTQQNLFHLGVDVACTMETTRRRRRSGMTSVLANRGVR